MPVKYCPSSSCGERFTYSALTPPTKCPSCGNLLAKAFQSTPIQASIAQTVAPAAVRVTSSSSPDGEDDDHFDSYEVQANAKLLAQEIDPDDFLVTHQKEEPLKVGTTIKIINTPAPTPRAPAKTRGTRRGKK